MLKHISTLWRSWVVAHERFNDRLFSWGGDTYHLSARK